MAKIKRQGLRDLVYRELHEMIENSRFSPGGRIVVEDLTKELGVSRTPVWQAIGLLEREGYLTYKPNVGVFMQEISPNDALDLYSVRGVLEGMAARLASEGISISQLKELRENLSRQESILPEKNFIEYSKLDFDFHALVYQASNNNCLIELLDNLKHKMKPLVCDITPIMNELYLHHQEIVQALEDKDPERAHDLFLRHNDLMIKQIFMQRKFDLK
ncbi:MAG: GntR family transcriptional regulator [Sphaerochaeta sp.]|nr:GntR family transcriptional regulator [Sphaerochaeta sp.]